mmetsp:Transcript_138494/g.336605  ORF Transcript_138494/g.336605 Transcript_138494/m.336605 type:complete len:495 (-) Transcript_138494:32-1516(-)
MEERRRRPRSGAWRLTEHAVLLARPGEGAGLQELLEERDPALQARVAVAVEGLREEAGDSALAPRGLERREQQLGALREHDRRVLPVGVHGEAAVPLQSLRAEILLVVRAVVQQRDEVAELLEPREAEHADCCMLEGRQGLEPGARQLAVDGDGSLREVRGSAHGVLEWLQRFQDLSECGRDWLLRGLLQGRPDLLSHARALARRRRHDGHRHAGPLQARPPRLEPRYHALRRLADALQVLARHRCERQQLRAVPVGDDEVVPTGRRERVAAYVPSMRAVGVRLGPKTLQAQAKYGYRPVLLVPRADRQAGIYAIAKLLAVSDWHGDSISRQQASLCYAVQILLSGLVEYNLDAAAWVARRAHHAGLLEPPPRRGSEERRLRRPPPGGGPQLLDAPHVQGGGLRLARQAPALELGHGLVPAALPARPARVVLGGGLRLAPQPPPEDVRPVPAALPGHPVEVVVAAAGAAPVALPALRQVVRALHGSWLRCPLHC